MAEVGVKPKTDTHNNKKRGKTSMQNKPKRKVSNIMLVLICTMIISYTIATFILQYFTSVEISPTLTTAWFSFWGVELVALAAIKTSKLKHNQDTYPEENEECTINEEE